MGPITFGAQIPPTEFSNFGSGVYDRSSGKTQGKVKRVREWGIFENFAKKSKHNREGGNRCNQDGSEMPPNREGARGHSDSK